MTRLYIFLTGVLGAWLLFCGFALAQPRGGDTAVPGGSISGTVRDKATGNPIAYAEVVLKLADGSQVTGTVTDNDGAFALAGIRPGAYKVEVFFLGYQTQVFEEVRISRRNRQAQLTDIKLVPAMVEGQEVKVEGRRAPVSYQIDKKVISVDENQTAASGNAADVLQNVPSVTVDIDGNVSMRGSSNFRVLIDGRPSILDAQDALQQIPAVSIDNIELITNPSAKYDPEGTAGIINIVLKKNRSNTRGGLLSVDAGTNDKYGINAIYDMRFNKFSGTLGVDYNRNFRDSETSEENRTTSNGITSFNLSDGLSTRGRFGYGLRGSLAWEPNSMRVVSMDFRVGDRNFEGDSKLNFDAWDESDPQHILSTSTNESSRKGTFYSGGLAAEQRFGNKDHKLKADISLNRMDMDENTTNELRGENGALTDGQRSFEYGPGVRAEANLEYSRPMGSERLLELGYKYSFNQSEDNTGFDLYNPLSAVYERQIDSQYFTDYERHIHALFAIHRGKAGKLGYQLGLRGEYTDRNVLFVTGESQRFIIDRKDVFPSAHFSYGLPAGRQLMASYARRIERPRGWFLEPFVTYDDAFNVRSGNPALQPEYIDSYEAGFQTALGQSLFSSEMYYRIGRDRIERVRSVYAENVTLTAPQNVGTDYALGSELMLNMDISKKWNLNLLGNLYNYRIKGVLGELPFERESFNWNVRANNSLRLNRDLQVQLNGRYNSNSVSAQGKSDGFLTTDLAVKYSFMDQRLSATLQVDDLFGTEKFEQLSQGVDFYNLRISDSESPQVRINLRYTFNNYRPKREQREGGEQRGGGEEEF